MTYLLDQTVTEQKSYENLDLGYQFVDS